MKSFFDSVKRHIGKLGETKLREQYMLLSQELSQLDLIFESMNEGVIFCNPHGEVTSENQAVKAILGMSATEAIESLAIPLDIPAKREVSVAYPDPKTAVVQILPVAKGTVLIVRDTTAERAAADKALESGAFKAVSTLAAGLAHEIGNPLNALSMNLQLMESSTTDKESLEICKQQVKRIGDFTRNFLQALRPTKPNLVPGSVAEPLKSCLAALKSVLEDKQISVTLEIPSALPAVALDVMQIEHVFFNLVKNALEAMPDGKRLDITITSDDNTVAVRFTDNGYGMTPEQLAHLFEPYRTTKSSGNGLGLMICSRIVHDHGGTIDAESEIDKGTTFTITLPRLEKRIRALQ